MRRLLARLTAAACLLGACRGPSKEPGHIAIEDRIPLPGPPPAALALSEFRPRMLAGVDSGGRCREDFYWSARGYRGVVWRREGENRRFWKIQVATDSAGVVRRYYEDRYGYTAGRTIIWVDFDAGRASAANDIADLPAQTVAADAATVFHAPQLGDPSRQAARILERCHASLDPWGSLARFPDSLTAPPPRWSWGEWTVGGWIGTSSEGTALPVLVLRDDGWLRFRSAPPTTGDDGTVWTHRSHLAAGDVTLAVTRWEAHVLQQDVPTYFRG